MNIGPNDDFFVNETYRFIYPILRLYGEDFYSKIRMMFKQGVFIDDIMNIRYDEKDYLHIVVNVPVTVKRFGKMFICDAINYLRAGGYMLKDYIPSVKQTSKEPQQIVLMILIPQKYQGCINKFLKGEIDLFSKEDVEHCFKANVKENEPYFAYCRNCIATKRKIDINLENEVLNY